MYLSDAAGNFSATPTEIGRYTGFYSTYVNGIIPAGTPTGNNYRIRIVASSNGLTTTTGAFTINAALPTVTASIISSKSISNAAANANNMQTFGFCAPTTGSAADITLANGSSAAASATFTNEIDGTTNTVTIDPQITYRPDVGHYTMFVKVTMPNGTVATKAYFIINSTTVTSLNTSGANTVCLPGGNLSYAISPAAYERNFPGNTYSVNWGDNTTNTYTHCELMLNGAISHTYTTSSCGQTNVNGSVTTYNAFGINLQTINPFCGNVGTPISTTAKVVNSTENRFNGPLLGCSNADVTFVNQSLLGDDPNNTGPTCLPDNATFNWYVDGVLKLAGVPITTDFVYRFTSGNHTVTLESTSTNGCTTPNVTRNICVQNPPVPAFNFTPSNTCGPVVLTPNNTSTIDNVCNANNVYTWNVSPAVNFVGGTDSHSAAPQFDFSTPGVYTISLSVSTATCGVVTSAPQEVIINSNPVAILSNDTDICNLGTYDFTPTGPPVTRTLVSGTAADQPNTYTWTVTPNTFAFANGTDLHTKYPSITFNDYVTYTVTLTHTNSCGTTVATQHITFKPAPAVYAGPDIPMCYNDPTVTLAGTITGASTGNTWVGGNGTFAPDRNTLNAVYTPTAAERLAGQVTLTLRVTTSLPSPCNVIEDEVNINITQNVTVNSSNTKSICTGANVNYTPTSATAGVTFSWTATGSANAGGYAAGNGTTISDILTNSDPNANATVTYTITPSINGCAGTPFTLTVTVTPNPIVTPVTPVTLCSGQSTNINLASNLAGTTYVWTSVASAGITGNTNGNGATIVNQLSNSGTTAGTVTYTVTPTSANGCPGNPEQIIVNVDPAPTASFAGPNESICDISTYTLRGNNPSIGTGLWTQISGPTTVVFANDTQNNSLVSNLQTGGTYVFRWTITGAASCAPSSSDVTITVNPQSVGGTSAGATTVCAGTNTGQITLSGQTGSVIRWESSTDGLTWSPINETNTTLTFNDLLVTTQFRAVVQSGVCTSANSTATTVTVNQPVTTANAGQPQVLCNVTTTTLNGNNPNPNTGTWTVVSPPTPNVTFVDPSLPNATVNGLVAGNTYTFRWTISGSASCPPSTSDVTVTIELPSDGGTANGSATVCAGNNGGNITLSGQVGNIIRWESSTDGFNTVTTIAATTTSIPYANLNTTTQYRAVVQNGTCGAANSAVATISVNQQAVAANAGLDQELCNQTTTTLNGNSPGINTGLWTIISGPAGATIDQPAQYNSPVSGLVPGTYIFRWTVSGQAPCGATSDDVTIVNLAPIQNNTINTPITTNCTGQTITLTGAQPTGGSNVYTFSWESSPTGNAPWTTINGQTARDLTIVVNNTMSYRRVVNSGACSTISNVLTITALPPIASNSIATDQVICAGTNPLPIVGSQPTGGDGANYTYGWESSPDGLTNWSFVPGATGRDIAPTGLAQTTYFRRLVSSAACTGAQQSVSNVVKITVNPNARAEFTWTNDIGCVNFVIDQNNVKAVPYADRNDVYTWYVDGVQIGQGITFPGYTISTYNTEIEIKLVVTSSLNCDPSEISHRFKTYPNIAAGFTQDRNAGCGPLDVTFTNTTAAAATNVYEWSIDGVVVSNARDLGTRTFAPTNQGIDRTYNILLRVTSDCGVTSVASTVVVNSTPIPAISAVKDNGCSDFHAEFINTTPGKATNTYIVDFGDGSAPVAYNWGDAITHTYTTTTVRDFPVTITATNSCGSVTSQPIYVRVSPNDIVPIFFAPPAQQTVCAGTEVTFQNNSAGASRFTYDFKDGSPIVASPSGLPETIHRIFNQPGTYDVTMTAYNDCATPRSAVQRIVVLARPQAIFSADVNTGCTGLAVQFTQASTDAIRYDWNFGDGTNPSTEENPEHVFNVPPGTYTVTLTVTNQLQCSHTTTHTITIVGPPTADFAPSPAATISIPDYTFRFTNLSTNGAETYKWSFGDGDFSTQKDPVHTYPDTGQFKVELIAFNKYGCSDTIPITVRIVGVPGYTFVPNSFIPGSTSVQLQTFRAVGSGMKSWKMTILNKWGQVLWETTKLEDGKPVEGWDGTFKGVPQPQGIYFWKIEVELINGSEWKGMSIGNAPPRRTGQIYLIR